MDDKRGMRLADALEGVIPEKAAPADDWSQLGKGLMGSLMDQFAKQVQTLGQGAQASQPDMMDQIMKYAMGMKALKEVFGGSEDAAPADKGIWTYLAEQQKSQTALLAALLKGNAPADPMESFTKAMQLVRELKPEADQRSQAFDQLAQTALLEKLQSNPLQGYLEMRKMIKEELESEGNRENVIDIEVWKTKEQFKLEREKLQAEREERRAQQENTQRLFGGFTEMIKPEPGGAPAQPAAAAPRTVGTPDNLVRYECHACKAKFVQQRTAQGTCPQCGASFTDPNAGPAAAPATPAPAGPDPAAPDAALVPPVSDPSGMDLWPQEVGY